VPDRHPNHDPGEVEVAKLAGYIPMSTEVMEDARLFADAWHAYQRMTPEERQAAAERAREQRTAERAAAERAELTVDTLRETLGWSTAFAEHYVQPYCGCYVGEDGLWTCEHARDEGIEP
jgi:hypothetical protein